MPTEYPKNDYTELVELASELAIKNDQLTQVAKDQAAIISEKTSKLEELAKWVS